MEWAYGITTVPNRVSKLLPETLTSLAAAGFDRPVLFVDGIDENWAPPAAIGGLVMHHPKVGHIPNWTLALLHLFTVKPKAARYAIFEDDLLATKGLRDYLNLWYPERGYLNLITHPENLLKTQGVDGWHESNQRGRGAVGLVFNREVARSILSSHITLDRTHVEGPICADGMVMDSLNVLGYKEYIHCPTLIQHVGGGQSALGHQYGEMPGWRGEDFDLTSIINRKEEQVTVLPATKGETLSLTSPIKVIIPTRKSAADLEPLVNQIKDTAGVDCEVFVTGVADGSASKNRNVGLDWAHDQEFVCMIDDDCQVPHHGWLQRMFDVISRNDVLFVSAALYTDSGMPAYMTGVQDCGGMHQPQGEWECPTKRVLTACCMFRPFKLRFDEDYVGSGFEDTDYCNQLAKLHPAGKFIVAFEAKVVHNNEMKEQRNNWEHNRTLYFSKWEQGRFRPTIALYKTYRGGEWFEASLESIAKHVEGIVVVACKKPWDRTIEALPENCLEPLAQFKLRHPEIRLETIIIDRYMDQAFQYRIGLRAVETVFGLDKAILVIDSDEVWEDKDIIYLKAAMAMGGDTTYFRSRIHNYIKQPNWRITPQEPHRPVVGLRNATATYVHGRFLGAHNSHYKDLEISYHHFPLVRLDEKEILHKLLNTASQDGPMLDGWIENVWDKLPEGQDIHPAKNYEKCWGGVEVVDIKTLPIHARNSLVVNRLLTSTPDKGDNMVPTVVMERHILGFHKRLDEWPELFSLEFWRAQESYSLIKAHCNPEDVILEVGCLNGHHCLLLAEDSYDKVTGIEFNGECIKMAEDKKAELGLDVSPKFLYGEFPEVTVEGKVDKIILFDVIEHMTNLQSVFEECSRLLSDAGEVLVLVPKGKHYYDSGHINFWLDEETLTNHLEVYFNVVECKTVEEDKKLFARCISKEAIYEALQNSRVGCNMAV